MNEMQRVQYRFSFSQISNESRNMQTFLMTFDYNKYFSTHFFGLKLPAASNDTKRNSFMKMSETNKLNKKQQILYIYIYIKTYMK